MAGCSHGNFVWCTATPRPNPEAGEVVRGSGSSGDPVVIMEAAVIPLSLIEGLFGVKLSFTCYFCAAPRGYELLVPIKALFKSGQPPPWGSAPALSPKGLRTPYPGDCEKSHGSNGHQCAQADSVLCPSFGSPGGCPPEINCARCAYIGLGEARCSLGRQRFWYDDRHRPTWADSDASGDNAEANGGNR